MKGRVVKISKLKDDNGDDYIIRDIASFYNHILEYHASGTSLHEENGHYFTVNDDFRFKIEKLYLKNN